MRRLVPLLLCLLLLAACGESAGTQSGLSAIWYGTSHTPELSSVEMQNTEETTDTGAENRDSSGGENDGPPKYLPETSPEKETEYGEAGATETQLHALLSGMSREQKVGQLFFVFCEAEHMDELIAQYRPGGVLLFTRDYQDGSGAWLSKDAVVNKLGAMQRAALDNGGIGLFIGSDEEGGTVTRASRNPNLFPQRSLSPQALDRQGGLNAVLSDAAEKSYLLRSIGVNVNFAPVCDVSVDSSDWIYPRTLGKNAEETARYTSAVVTVMRDSGMAAVLKHFPGYGGTADTHTGAAVDDRPLERFRQSDLVPFSAGIQAGAPFVLVSHNLVRCMDASLPASLSPAVHTLLRNELRFSGIVITDDLAMGALNGYSTEDAAVMAVRAGNDMLLTSSFEAQRLAVLNALETGALDEALLDAACLRILRVKAEMGLLS